MKILKGSLLNVKSGYVVQQCNCNTVRSHGLSEKIKEKFPYCNVYTRRVSLGNRNRTVTPDRPGTYQLFESPYGPTIVCLMAQWAPGKPGHYAAYYPAPPAPDTKEQRLRWFIESMTLFLQERSNKEWTINLPHGIGCGLAGGDWDAYQKALQSLEQTYEIEFIIYQL